MDAGSLLGRWKAFPEKKGKSLVVLIVKKRRLIGILMNFLKFIFMIHAILEENILFGKG